MAFSYSAAVVAAASSAPVVTTSNSAYIQNYAQYAPPSSSAVPSAAAVAAAALAAGGGRSTPSDSSPHMTRAGSRSNVASSRGSRASSAGSPHPSSTARTEPEDEGEGGAAKKKRRRNRRRKKKSGNSEDTGALSDEPLADLRRAHSSSNVSRTSADHPDPGESSGLRFEDEEEFPNLLSAASSRDRKSASHTNLSYSDILKNTNVSELFFFHFDLVDVLSVVSLKPLLHCPTVELN